MTGTTEMPVIATSKATTQSGLQSCLDRSWVTRLGLPRRFVPRNDQGDDGLRFQARLVAEVLWRHPRLLAPASAIARSVTALRLTRTGWFCPVPVICVGNATMGGAGKTTVTLDLTRRLTARGWDVHVLLRGYGGSARGPHWVQSRDSAALVGDEALLHAVVAPTWVGADRKRGAQAAVAAGTEVILLDDGLQNPGVQKRLSLLVVDGATGFGNGRVFPAGPLREPVTSAASRCQAAVLIGSDATGALGSLPPGLPVHRARLKAGPEAAAFAGRRVLGFAGIAMPDKFFASLVETGAALVARRPFPDHHRYSRPELDSVLAEAERLDALPVTTAKDAVRLPPDVRVRVQVLTVGLDWADPDAPEALLRSAINTWASEGRYRRSYA
ncbi:MAG TPA: tetraacyldisaccharide 4'-kinase [Acetobacteraceae bacterium]|nr:tetraacyldisaccharide 4'-kinase [Acetobacteraceae bacterium]